ncbi:MAG: hypothetical protein F6K31_40390 [Symploca sp. SIO2G7]|nr:hypothetical protein [Symploca sp. SIO2G7]
MSKNTKNKYRRIADSDAQAVSDEKLRVSFEYIDWNTEEFFFHGMEVKYYQKMFACIYLKITADCTALFGIILSI